MNKLAEITAAITSMAKRVFVKRDRNASLSNGHTWGILTPENTVAETLTRQKFDQTVDHLVLRDVKFHSCYTKDARGCGGEYTGAAEGTPEAEPPPSNRPHVKLGFDRATGMFYRQDTNKPVEIVKRLYLLPDGKNEAEILD